jgi:hypothetical protein
VTANRGIVVAASAASTFLLAGCDPGVAVEVTNSCGYAVELSTFPGDDGIPPVAPGATQRVATIGYSLSLYVRAVGDGSWPVVVEWDSMATADPEGLRTLVLEGDTCPPLREPAPPSPVG